MIEDNLLRFRKDIKYAWVDLETFSLCLNFQQNRPWQVGVLDVVDKKTINSLDLRVNWPDAPHLKIGDGAAMITRYSQQEQDRLAIHYKDAFVQFWPVLEKADYICGHNILGFDLYLIKGYAEIMGKPWKWIIPKIIDTKAIAQGIKMEIPYDKNRETFMEYQFRLSNTYKKGIKTNLGQLCKDYGIEVDEYKQHDAIYDLAINKLVWEKMIYQIEI